jgi:hypothetical protein
MKNLFSYHPLVEIDNNNPVNQLLEILNNLESFRSLIDKNYDEVRKNHQWINRCQQIEKILHAL